MSQMEMSALSCPATELANNSGNALWRTTVSSGGSVQMCFILCMWPAGGDLVTCIQVSTLMFSSIFGKCQILTLLNMFLRNRLQDKTAKRFLTLGSRFRYNGRTLSECLEASANITRPPPQFLRLATKRKGLSVCLLHIYIYSFSRHVYLKAMGEHLIFCEWLYS